MKIKYLSWIIISLLLSFMSKAQTSEFHYTYYDSGNRIVRAHVLSEE